MSVGFTCQAVVQDKRFVKQMIRMLGEEKRYEVRQEEDCMRVGFCRLGDVFFQFSSGLDGEIPAQMVYGECTSSLAGAGFHAAAVHFVEELARETDLEFILDDETGYGDDHDFERMREEHFYGWLKNLVAVCREREEKWPDAVSFGLCWDLDQYTPEEVPGTVFTPFGRFSVQKMLGWVENEGIEPFAKEFFIWNEPGRDAGYYRNTALSLMWEECCFMPGSRSEWDKRMNDRIIDDLEKALLLDRGLPFPTEEYILLCRLNGKEPEAVADVPVYEPDYPIGYRRGNVRDKIGTMTFVVPGSYLYEYDEDSNSHLWYDGLEEDWHAIRITALKSREESPEITERIFDGAEGEPISGENGCLAYRFAFAGTIVHETDGPCSQYVGEVAGGYQIALITASCEHREDEWAEAFFRSMSHSPEANLEK